MSTSLHIGIDGGGSGCRVALRLTGGPRIEVSGGPANAFADLDGACATIIQTVYQAVAMGGLTRGDLSGAKIVAGIAGCRMPGLAALIQGRLPFLALVYDDSVTTLRGAFGTADGTLISLGTGSFFLRQKAGALRHVGGWGFDLGDEASGAWLGRRALGSALQVEDGRRAPDALTRALTQATQPHPLRFAAGARPSDYAALAPLVLDHLDTDLGQTLLADTICQIEAGLTALDHQPGQPIVLTGGLANSLRAHLPPALIADLIPALGTALDGALSMALDIT
jgi:glucosamine kinase